MRIRGRVSRSMGEARPFSLVLDGEPLGRVDGLLEKCSPFGKWIMNSQRIFTKTFVLGALSLFVLALVPASAGQGTFKGSPSQVGPAVQKAPVPLPSAVPKVPVLPQLKPGAASQLPPKGLQPGVVPLHLQPGALSKPTFLPQPGTEPAFSLSPGVVTTTKVPGGPEGVVITGTKVPRGSEGVVITTTITTTKVRGGSEGVVYAPTKAPGGSEGVVYTDTKPPGGSEGGKDDD